MDGRVRLVTTGALAQAAAGGAVLLALGLSWPLALTGLVGGAVVGVLAEGRLDVFTDGAAAAAAGGLALFVLFAALNTYRAWQGADGSAAADAALVSVFTLAGVSLVLLPFLGAGGALAAYYGRRFRRRLTA
jgi:hypothetical protein